MTGELSHAFQMDGSNGSGKLLWHPVKTAVVQLFHVDEEHTQLAQLELS